jgi:hypothetical protein
MSSYKAVERALNRYRETRIVPTIHLNQEYMGLNFTNFSMMNVTIGDRAAFGHPSFSGIIDLGQPFGYRFVVVKFVDDKGKVSYRIKTGCRWFTRDKALTHINWQPKSRAYRNRLRDGLVSERGGIKELLVAVDSLARAHWGFKVPK